MQSSAMHNPRLVMVPPQTFKFSKGMFYCTSPKWILTGTLYPRNYYPKRVFKSDLHRFFFMQTSYRMTPESLH